MTIDELKAQGLHRLDTRDYRHDGEIVSPHPWDRKATVERSAAIIGPVQASAWSLAEHYPY